MNYVLNLLNIGFKLGKNHDMDAIREQVEDKDAFDEGFFFEESALKVA